MTEGASKEEAAYDKFKSRYGWLTLECVENKLWRNHDILYLREEILEYRVLFCILPSIELQGTVLKTTNLAFLESKSSKKDLEKPFALCAGATAASAATASEAWPWEGEI